MLKSHEHILLGRSREDFERLREAYQSATSTAMVTTQYPRVPADTSEVKLAQFQRDLLASSKAK